MNKEIYTCNRLSSRGLEAWCIHLKPRVNLPSLSKSLRPGKPGMTRQLDKSIAYDPELVNDRPAIG